LTIELDYKSINGPDCDPDWYCALASPSSSRPVDSPSRPITRQTSNRRKVGKRIRTPVLALEPAPNRTVLTVPETAWVLDCSPNTVWNLIATEQLPSFKLDRKRLLARETVEAFISESEAKS
jgi:hypothetical protein